MAMPSFMSMCIDFLSHMAQSLMSACSMTHVLHIHTSNILVYMVYRLCPRLSHGSGDIDISIKQYDHYRNTLMLMSCHRSK